MAGLLVVECRVQVKTIHFDKNSDHEWSKHEFGNDWETSFCEGTVMQVTKNARSCRMRWDSDGSVTRVPCSMVERIGEDSEDQGHQSSDSDESDSGTTSQDSSESSEDEDSGDEETDEGSSSSSDENTVQAHGIKWLFREGVVDGNYKDQRYKPVLRVGHPVGLT